MKRGGSSSAATATAADGGTAKAAKPAAVSSPQRSSVNFGATVTVPDVTPAATSPAGAAAVEAVEDTKTPPTAATMYVI